MSQKEYITSLCEDNPGAVVVGSIGSISYDLTDIPHPRKVLIRGAMGAAIPCALGIALNTPAQVIVIVGEGSLLMKAGALSTVFAYAPKNLKIVVMNNGCYKSCGGQKNNFEAFRKNVLFTTAGIEIIDVKV